MLLAARHIPVRGPHQHTQGDLDDPRVPSALHEGAVADRHCGLLQTRGAETVHAGHVHQPVRHRCGGDLYVFQRQEQEQPRTPLLPGPALRVAVDGHLCCAEHLRKGCADSQEHQEHQERQRYQRWCQFQAGQGAAGQDNHPAVLLVHRVRAHASGAAELDAVLLRGHHNVPPVLQAGSAAAVAQRGPLPAGHAGVPAHRPALASQLLSGQHRQAHSGHLRGTAVGEQALPRGPARRSGNHGWPLRLRPGQIRDPRASPPATEQVYSHISRTQNI